MWSFLNTYNSFFWPLIVVGNPDQYTLPLGIQSIYAAEARQVDLVLAASVLAAIPSLLLFTLLRKQLLEGLTAAPSRVEGSTVYVPAHLPDRFTITLWDFTWYTPTGPGEPFADLDTAFAQAVARGYNTVRVCAMPFLLFRSGLDTTALSFTGLGGGYGQATRWYDVCATTTLDGRQHLLALFQAAARHDCRIIVSSWEYQQSPAFLAGPDWHHALRAVPPTDRITVLADALADLVDLVAAHGLADRIAFVELHNEVQGSRLTDVVPPGVPPVLGLQPYLTAGIDRFKRRHPDVLVTANYARVPVDAMRALPQDADVAVFHPYVYGVLDELFDTFALRAADRPFPQDRADRELLRDDAPRLEQWLPPEKDRWRLEATVVGRREVYVHDWCDPLKWDANPSIRLRRRGRRP